MYTPNFTITPKLTNWIAQIEAIKQKIDRSSILPEKEIFLRYRAAIESVHSSTSIEGNPLNEKQVEAALTGKMNNWEKKVIEVTNYKKAWDWIINRRAESPKITTQDILRLHMLVADQLLATEKVGKLRSGQVYIVDIIEGREIVKYTGPKSSLLENLIADLLAFVDAEKNTLHPVLLAGILHYEFVSIHPFSDGNGRVTRLLVKLLLDLLGYDFRGCLALDSYYWQNTNSYYRHLNQAKKYSDQRKADLTDWLSYFVEGFYLVVKDLERKIDIVKISKKTPTILLSNDDIQILDFVHQFRQISLKDTLDILQVPERTGQRRLKNLVDKGLLVTEGRGKNIQYILKSTRAKAFTLLELLITSSITAILMLAISSLFITFLATAYKSRISQSLRESGGNAMRQMTDMIRSASEITSDCDATVPLDSITLIGPDGLETVIREEDDRIASVGANGKFYLTESASSPDYLRNLLFTCYPTVESKKYIQVSFNLRVGEGEANNSARSTSLDFSSGVATRN